MKEKLKRDFKSKFNEGDNENYLGLQMVDEIFDFFYAEIEGIRQFRSVRIRHEN